MLFRVVQDAQETAAVAPHPEFVALYDSAVLGFNQWRDYKLEPQLAECLVLYCNHNR